ncbi:cytochrome P450 2C16-like [Lacerta agilis]|uniref:cytochrome P450 2C16-like n=1 Tax=Lacerta agilis TaxID=80427 RepID=UPI00141A537B|nr:cytochrome P450 2C16-like [Lacerta agilis]
MEVIGEAGIIFLLLVLSILLFSSMKMYQGQLPPGPTPWPLLGNLLQKDTRNVSDSYQKLSMKYGPIFTIWMGPKPVVVLCGYEVVKDALVNYSEEFGGQPPLPIFDSVTKGRGLLSTNEMKWKELRRFTLSTLRNFGMGKMMMSERIQEEANCLVEVMATTQGQAFDPQNSISSAVANVISAMLLGSSFGHNNQDFLEYQRIMMDFLRFSHTFSGLVYNCIPKIMDYLPGRHKKVFADCEKLCTFIHERVEYHRQTLDPQNPRDYMDCFLIKFEKEQYSASGLYTTEDLVMNTFVLLQGGTLSMTHFLLYSLLVMTMYPHIQEKVQQEIDEVVGANRTPNMEDRVRLPFTNAVIHEILRYELNSVDPIPHMMTQHTDFRGYSIPQGTTVFPMTVSVLFDPLHWETPDEFNPGHFLNEKGEFRKRDAFMPFLAGKRACPAEALALTELFLFFTSLLQNFCFHIVSEERDITSLFYNFNRRGLYPQIQAIQRCK